MPLDRAQEEAQRLAREVYSGLSDSHVKMLADGIRHGLELAGVVVDDETIRRFRVAFERQWEVTPNVEASRAVLVEAIGIRKPMTDVAQIEAPTLVCNRPGCGVTTACDRCDR